jgi:hypothetical protein
MNRKPGTGHFPDAPSDGPSGITLQGKKVSDEPSEAEALDMPQAYADARAMRRNSVSIALNCTEHMRISSMNRFDELRDYDATALQTYY